MFIPEEAPVRPHQFLRKVAFAALCALTLVLSAVALAQNGPATPSTGAASFDRIEIDQDEHVIRFIIEGKEVARLDAQGLHVREGIEYGGALTKTGTASFDKHATEGADAQ